MIPSPDVGRAPRALVRALLAVVAVDTAATLAVLAWAGGWFEAGLPSGVDLGTTVALTAWVLAPLVGTGALVLVTARRLPRGLVATAVGVVLLTVLTVGALLSFLRSESSTAALVFLTLPLVQWLLVLVTLGAAALQHRWAGRASRR